MEHFEILTGSLLEMNRYLQKIKDHAAEQLGLRGSHISAIYYLAQNPEGLTVTELSNISREDKAAVSRSLSQLAAGGLVRGGSSENRRAYRTRLTLTREGQEAAEKVLERLHADLRCIESGLTQDQISDFYGVLERMLGSLDRHFAG